MKENEAGGKKGELIKLFKENSTMKKPKKGIEIIGNQNAIGNNNTFINTNEYISRPKVEIKRDGGYITDAQAALLKSLVGEIVALEKIAKQKAKSYGAVYNSLFRNLSTNKKHPEIPQYRLIPYEKFEKAEKFLRTWIGRLSSSKKTMKKDPDWRKRKYSYIKLNEKKFNLTARLQAYMLKQHRTTSLRELSDDALQLTYSNVSKWIKEQER